MRGWGGLPEVAAVRIRNGLRRVGWRRASTVAVLLVASVAAASRVEKAWPRAARWAALDTYTRVAEWIASADCLLATGVPLALCDAQGRPFPLEDRALADDRGHTVLANGIAFATDAPVTRLHLVQLNLVLNALGVIAVAWALAAAGLPAAAIAAAILGAWLAVPGPNPSADATAAFPAAFLFGLAAPIWIAPVAWNARLRARDVWPFGLAALSLAASTLLRQPFGLGAAAATGVVALVALARCTGAGAAAPTRAARLALLAGALAAAVWITPALVEIRSTLFGVPRGVGTIDHGIAHNLYLGLGTEPNPWGIVWSDAAGAEAIQGADPAASYVSDRYYRTAWALYLSRVREAPAAALRIYVTKSLRSIAVLAGSRPGRFVPFAILAAGATCLAIRRRDRLGPSHALAFVGIVLCVAATIGQGVLGHPSPGYIGAGTLGAWIALFVGLESVAWSYARPTAREPEHGAVLAIA